MENKKWYNSNLRYGCLYSLILGSFFLVIIKIVYLKLYRSDSASKIIEKKGELLEKLQLKRRETLYDRNGKILAVSIKRKNLLCISDYKDYKEARKEIRLLLKHISFRVDKDKMDLIEKLLPRMHKNVELKRGLTQKEVVRIEKLKGKGQLKDIYLRETYKREYPYKSLAAPYIGAVGRFENGLFGVEKKIDYLRGIDSTLEEQKSAVPRLYKLTLDVDLQYYAEKVLMKAIKENKAKSGTVLVMDANKGDLLVIANYPSFNPYRPKKALLNKTFRNMATFFSYDPGSTMKVVTLAIALDKGICRQGDIFDLKGGVLSIYRGKKIRDVHFDKKLGNKRNVREIIVSSSNVGAALIGQKIGKKNLYNGLKDFGFGERTNFLFTAESKGILNDIDSWTPKSILYISHGYEVNATPMQMCRAFNVIASKGFLVKPRIFLGEKIEKKRIIKKSTAQKVRDIMVEVVESPKGTGKKASVAGVKVAGKTGTAQKLIRGKYQKMYISSFGGFLPAKNPIFTIFVVINEPEAGRYYGGDVAAPIFQSIGTKLMEYVELGYKNGEKQAI